MKGRKLKLIIMKLDYKPGFAPKFSVIIIIFPLCPTLCTILVKPSLVRLLRNVFGILENSIKNTLMY